MFFLLIKKHLLISDEQYIIEKVQRHKTHDTRHTAHGTRRAVYGTRRAPCVMRRSSSGKRTEFNSIRLIW